jgi:hypothetical protein
MEVAFLAFRPAHAVVAIGGKTELNAVATLNDGSSKDVTDGVAWASSDPRTIGAASSGLVSGWPTRESIDGVQSTGHPGLRLGQRHPPHKLAKVLHEHDVGLAELALAEKN